jgi:hypothetical protein
MQALAHGASPRPHLYVGMLVWPTQRSVLRSRMAKLEDLLEQPVHTGTETLSRDGKWTWRFACARISAIDEEQDG